MGGPGTRHQPWTRRLDGSEMLSMATSTRSRSAVTGFEHRPLKFVTPVIAAFEVLSQTQRDGEQ